MAVTARWRLQTAAALDLTPSMHWRTPVFVYPIEDDQGPIMVTVEYVIDPKDLKPFLALIHEIGLERKRDGAYAWGVFEDTQVSGRIVETFLIQSLLELKHLRTRVTMADRMIEEQARAFVKQPPRVTFLVAPKRHRQKRRKGSKLLAPQAPNRPRSGRGADKAQVNRTQSRSAEPRAPIRRSASPSGEEPPPQSRCDGSG
jgi:hypothetical protein